MVLIGGEKRATNWMNLSQLRRAVWLRRLSDAIQGRFTLLKNHHRLGWLPETATEFRCPFSICFTQAPVFTSRSWRGFLLLAAALKEVVKHRKDLAAVADLAHRQRRSIGAQTLIQRPKR